MLGLGFLLVVSLSYGISFFRVFFVVVLFVSFSLFPVFVVSFAVRLGYLLVLFVWQGFLLFAGVLLRRVGGFCWVSSRGFCFVPVVGVPVVFLGLLPFQFLGFLLVYRESHARFCSLVSFCSMSICVPRFQVCFVSWDVVGMCRGTTPWGCVCISRCCISVIRVL